MISSAFVPSPEAKIIIFLFFFFFTHPNVIIPFKMNFIKDLKIKCNNKEKLYFFLLIVFFYYKVLYFCPQNLKNITYV